MVLVTCPTCGTDFYKPAAWVRRSGCHYCSRRCNGMARGSDWAQHAHEGRAAWSDASRGAHRERMTGETNPAWKGGVTLHNRKGKHGEQRIRYVKCLPEFSTMARRDGYVMEHRLLVAQAIGRPLLRSEVVHHVNHNAEDNRLENLALFPNNQAHKLHEAHGSPAPIWHG